MESVNGILYTSLVKPQYFQNPEFLLALTTFLEKIFDSIPKHWIPLLYDRDWHGDQQAIQQFFYPKLRYVKAHYKDIPNFLDAAKDMAVCIFDKSPIGIFTDYDVDGATSAAVLQRYFEYLGCKVYTYVPNRHQEGYGVNLQGIQELRSKGVRKILVCDSGTLSSSLFEETTGKDVIILDHHQLGSSYVSPKVSRFINVQLAPTYWRDLCTAGMAFFFTIAINDCLNKQDSTRSVPKDFLLSALDLVALGSVCDVVVLKGMNRLLVHLGLKLFNIPKHLNIGLKALSTYSTGKFITEYDLGFVIGPRINACSRMGQSSLALQLLTIHDTEKANKLAAVANELNIQRKKLEQQAFEDVCMQITQKTCYISPTCICVAGNYDIGIIGILAGRIKEQFHRPVLIYSTIACKGSGRSIKIKDIPINLGEIIHTLVQQNILPSGGGHAMAVGFSVYPNMQPDALGEAIDSLIQKKYKSFQSVVHYSATLFIQDINSKLILFLSALSPFGQGNAEPKILIKDLRIQKYKWINNKHVSCTLMDQKGGFIQGIAWNCENSPIRFFLTNEKKSFSVIAKIQTNNRYTNPNKPQLIIQDIIE